ncbi:UNVERIFIED_CONTAM: hypothetical protein GTU68_045756 [Idotea baltica]|nr:hypothetical protein [Idotea baltica]
MALGFVFSLYTFKHTRYMYKRLAACCHLLSSGCALIVLEVSATSVSFAASKLPLRHPPGSEWHYGFSFVLAWVTFVIEVLATLGFALCSRKRKKDKAPNEEFAIDEEPTIIGR